jgi:GTP-binding protein YchF
MSRLEAGLVGLPNSGKSSVFVALTGDPAVVAPHMFSTLESQAGEAPVRDPRLPRLARLSDSARTVPATLQVVDIAGLVRGASQGEGLGNQFLGAIRTTDAVLHVLRCFQDDTVAHPGGRVDPVDDLETVELELVLADQATVERRTERVARTAKSGEREAVAEQALLERLSVWLDSGRPARGFAEPMPDALDLLTAKPEILVANVDESGDPDEVARLAATAAGRGQTLISINAKLEAEVAELDASEREAFLAELGVEQPALDRISLAAYGALDLIPFFTTGPKETRAWTIRRGENAQRAAGRIHSDLERGFIRAEVIPYDRLIEAGSEAEAKRHGWLRVEGRDYVVADGDVLNVRFNV